MMNQWEVDYSKKQALEKEVTNMALIYRLMTRFTSFVAVEEQVRNVDGKFQTVQVPVEMPEGVSHDGVFGKAVPSHGGVPLGAVAPGRGGAMPPVPAMASPAAPPPPAPEAYISSQHAPMKKSVQRQTLPTSSRSESFKDRADG
jgi:Ca-activated chloride channel family protein